MEENKMIPTSTNELAGYDSNVSYGFEDTKAEDILIPRIKVINALSPERVEGEASEGDIINSLTKENIVGKRFIPIKQYYSNIWWNSDRNADVRMICRSFDGNIGTCESGALSCKACRKNEFDNTKKGADAQPSCTKYLNFLGYIEGSSMPVVLSFAKTNYNEGKKLLSIARSMRASIWDYAYKLSSKKISKDRNTWYIIVAQLVDKTTDDERKLAYDIFRTYEGSIVKTEYDEVQPENEAGASEAASEIQAEI